MSSFAEDVYLLPVANDKVSKSKWNVSCDCIRSKAARLILLWNFPVLLIYAFFNINNEFNYRSSYHTPILVTVGVSIIAVFAPIAGLLTDLKYSRYKAVPAFCLLKLYYFSWQLLLQRSSEGINYQ